MDSYDSYDSWGNPTSTGAQAANNPWQYAGGYYEASTNRIKMGARYYNPYRGRFTQTDPSGQEANRYAYVQCNPINATDTTGYITGACFGALVGFVGAFGLFVVSVIGATVGTATVPPVGAIGWWAAGFSFGVAISAGTAANSECSK